jgi:hypothetical protein
MSLSAVCITCTLSSLMRKVDAYSRCRYLEAAGVRGSTRATAYPRTLQKSAHSRRRLDEDSTSRCLFNLTRRDRERILYMQPHQQRKLAHEASQICSYTFHVSAMDGK